MAWAFLSMSLPVLYSFRRCPYAMRARLAIAYAQLPVELREVVLKDKPQAMLAISPKATVPVLQLSDGQVIDESLDIMRWALQQNDPDSWLANEQTQLDMIQQNDEVFKTHLDRYKYPNRYPQELQDLGEQAFELLHREKAEGFLQQYEQKLTAQTYLLGDSICLADMAILPFIRQFAHVDKAWFDAAPYPNVQQWLQYFLDSPLFKLIMPKFKQWQPNDEPVVFPH